MSVHPQVGWLVSYAVVFFGGSIEHRKKGNRKLGGGHKTRDMMVATCHVLVNGKVVSQVKSPDHLIN